MSLAQGVFSYQASLTLAPSESSAMFVVLFDSRCHLEPMPLLPCQHMVYTIWLESMAFGGFGRMSNCLEYLRTAAPMSYS